MRVLVIDLNAIITDYERAFWQSAGATGNWQLARVTPGVGGMAWVPAQLDNPLQQIMQISQLLRDQRATDELRLALSDCALCLVRVCLCPGLAWSSLAWPGLACRLLLWVDNVTRVVVKNNSLLATD